MRVSSLGGAGSCGVADAERGGWRTGTSPPVVQLPQYGRKLGAEKRGSHGTLNWAGHSSRAKFTEFAKFSSAAVWPRGQSASTALGSAHARARARARLRAEGVPQSWQPPGCGRHGARQDLSALGSRRALPHVARGPRLGRYGKRCLTAGALPPLRRWTL